MTEPDSSTITRLMSRYTLVFGGAAMASGWVSTRQFLSLAMVLVPEGALLLIAGALWHVRRRVNSPSGSS